MKKIYFIRGLFFLLTVLFTSILMAQENQEKNSDKDKYKPIVLKLNEDGSKYTRFIFWDQFQVGVNKLGEDDSKSFMNNRRLRMLAFGQFSPRFLFLFHVGTHSYNAQNADAGGKGGGDIFINDAWGEYAVAEKKLHIGAGVHFWAAISRLQRQSTFKYLTMDNANDRTWLNYGRSGSFVREFGIYAKGTLGKWQYVVSINDALNSYATTGATPLSSSSSVYAGAQIHDKFSEGGARYNYVARLEYQLLNAEGDKLPFKQGSTVSKKGNIFNLGAGVWMHPKAAVKLKSGATASTVADLLALPSFSEVEKQVEFENATHFAIDTFLDKNGITAYALFLNTDYGSNAGGKRFTGSNVTLSLGYLLTDDRKINLQPYIALNLLNPQGTDGVNWQSGTELKIGANLLHIGNFLKTTIEFQSNTAPAIEGLEQSTLNNLVVQAQFLM